MLPRFIETNDDIETWEEYLNKIPQNEIVGFILDRMLVDDKFFRLVESRFIKTDSTKTLKEILKAYDNEIYGAYDEKIVDTEYVVAITRNFMRAIEELKSEEMTREGFKHIVEVLKDGYQSYGLGWPDDDILLVDLLPDLGSSIDEIA